MIEKRRDRPPPWPRRLLWRGLHTYWRFARGMTLGVRALVIEPQQRVLLVKHSYVRGWHLPGGGVEVGETMLDALVRELQEEANVVLTGSASLHGVFHNQRASRRDHVALFVVREFRQPAPPQPTREIVATAFFALDALPEDTTASTRARIAEVFRGAPISETW